MAKTKIGVLGCDGSMGKRHVKNFTELGCDVEGYDVVKGLQMGRRELIDWADAVVIATPTPSHFYDIVNVTKPMLVEKPLVNTATELNNVKLEIGRIKLVGYNLRFHSCVKKAHEWMGEGLIGKPTWARFTCAQFNDKPAYLRDGVVLNWSHEIDLALHLLGDAFVVSSFIRTNPEDMASIILSHTNTKCTSIIYLDYLTKPERRGFSIIGENGSIDADLVARQIFLKDRDDKLIHCHFGKDSWDGNYLHEAMSFLAHVRGKVDPDHLIGCTAKEAMKVMDICLTAKEKNLYEQA